jgi:hypothetical protein
MDNINYILPTSDRCSVLLFDPTCRNTKNIFFVDVDFPILFFEQHAIGVSISLLDMHL